jgi:hypothetical protein
MTDLTTPIDCCLWPQKFHFHCPHRGAKIPERFPVVFDALISIFFVPTHQNPQFFRKFAKKFVTGAFDHATFLHEVLSVLLSFVLTRGLTVS